MKRPDGRTVHDVDAEIMTESFNIYPAAASAYVHETVDHGAGEYSRDHYIHVNTAEGFFSQLKRSLDGTYHHVSEYHLHRYLAEFDYRYSTRKVSDSDRTVAAIRKTTGKRLKYQDTAKGAGV